MSKGSDPPPAPNYTALANQQGELDKQAFAQTNYANRPNVSTPWGGSTWATGSMIDPSTGKPVTTWNQTQTLNPYLQLSLDDQLATGASRADLARDMMGQVIPSFSSPMDYSQFREVGDVTDPAVGRQRAEDAMYRSMTSRLDPRWEQMRKNAEIKLANQGLRPGDAGWDAAMANLTRGETDAYQMASDAAIQAGRAEQASNFDQQMGRQLQNAGLRQQEIAEMIGRRRLPLTELDALLAGQGLQPSQYGQGTPGAVGSYVAPNMMGAAQNQYNADVDAWNVGQARQQSLWSGLGQGAIGLGGMMLCDRRLKRDAVRIGQFCGVPIYSFTYLWGERGVGPMADEVPPYAVVKHSSGFNMVDMDRIKAGR